MPSKVLDAIGKPLATRHPYSVRAPIGKALNAQSWLAAIGPQPEERAGADAPSLHRMHVTTWAQSYMTDTQAWSHGR